MKRKIILLICGILSFALLFSGCTIKEDSEKSRVLGATFLDYVIQNDYASAYDMAKHVASEEEFGSVWNEMRNVLKDIKEEDLIALDNVMNQIKDNIDKANEEIGS